MKNYNNRKGNGKEDLLRLCTLSGTTEIGRNSILSNIKMKLSWLMLDIRSWARNVWN